jgi:restriction system protein
VSYQVDVAHDELHKVRVVKGADPDYVRRTAAMQIEQWQEQWGRKQESLKRAQTVRARSEQREERKRYEEDQKEDASNRTAEASEALEETRHTLEIAIGKSHPLDWSSLRSTAPYPVCVPKAPAVPFPPDPHPVPPEPLPTDVLFAPELSWWDKLFAKRRARIEAEAAALYAAAHARWLDECDRIAAHNAQAQQEVERQRAAAAAEHERAVQLWEEGRAAYVQQQGEENAAVARQQAAYEAKEPDAILAYCELILANSSYPDWCPKGADLDYNPESQLLVVEYALPAPDALPTLTEVKYIASRDEFVEKHLPTNQCERLYDELLYQITLRTIHELFAADTVDALALVVFNGFVRSIDRGTGLETNACVLSIQANKTEFSGISLAHVDPKVCFKQLKGVGSSKLHSVAPVAPIMRIRRDDGRFVAAHDVAYQLDDAYNLAAMDWEEFEHLIREVFEKEFTVTGGEVKVTRATRDGGVDAVAFDPDPIRGGKIVIQAKRYTNTVSAAAVRDLYGTVLNEGATKGILVTTSDYGPDAYIFANNKPLTLLNGANLLHLLEKHGHRARIDLKAARTTSMEQRTRSE